MAQTLFGRDIAFSVRTFRFTGGNQTSGDQEQTISCELHLEPAADVAATQPDDCSCYTENECALPGEKIRRKARSGRGELNHFRMMEPSKEEVCNINALFNLIYFGA